MLFKCKNCGTSHRVVFYLERKQPKKKPLYQHSLPPRSGLFLKFRQWRWSHNNTIPEAQSTIRVESKVIMSRQHWLIADCNLKATPEQLEQLAYACQEKDWSKANTVKNVKATGTWHDRIKEDFLTLHFLEDIGSFKKPVYRLTDHGKKFLRQFLDKRVSAFV